MCDVLVEEQILSLEFTLTTPGLLDRLPELVDRYRAVADVGVGTILSTDDAERAMDSGAQYLVTPTMDLAIVDAAVARRIPVFPGGLTPTELFSGWRAGATAVKIFPAQTVGAGYLKHLNGPFPDLLAVPSGGVDLRRPPNGSGPARSRSVSAGPCSATPWPVATWASSGAGADPSGRSSRSRPADGGAVDASSLSPHVRRGTRRVRHG